MDPRIAFFESLIRDKNSRILEFGPLNRPIAAKDRYPNSFTCDIRSTEEVKALYSGNDYLKATGISIDPETIVPVDYVAKGTYTEALEGVERFDCVIASHVLEHVEDLISALLDISNLLKPHGVFCIVYPDKRYCFDHFRTSASFRDAYGVYRNGGKVNSAMVLDFFYTVVPENNPFVFWNNEELIDRHLPTASFQDALDHYERSLKGERVDDVHYWPFTDLDFLQFLYDCTRAGLLPYRCVAFKPCARNDQQFMLALEYDPSVCEAPEGAEVLLRSWMKSALPDYYTAMEADRQETEQKLRQELSGQRVRGEALLGRVNLQEVQLSQMQETADSLRLGLEQATADRDRLAGELQHTAADRDRLTGQLQHAAEDRDRLAAELSTLRPQLEQADGDRVRLMAENRTLSAELAGMNSQYESISNSTIWRITGPLRRVLDRLKGRG